MKISERQLFDYIYCPARYEMKHIKNYPIEEPATMQKLLEKVAKYFYLNLLNEKVPSINELKAKWDSICKTHPDYIDGKKNLEGIGLIINLVNWASNNRILILDVDAKFNFMIDDIEIEGCMHPILSIQDNMQELLVTNFSSKIPERIMTEMQLKYTLDHFAFYQTYNQPLDGIRIHSVKKNQDILTYRTEPDYRRLRSTIKSVAKGIQNGVYYPRESHLCASCPANEYCKYWYQN